MKYLEMIDGIGDEYRWLIDDAGFSATALICATTKLGLSRELIVDLSMLFKIDLYFDSKNILYEVWDETFRF